MAIKIKSKTNCYDMLNKVGVAKELTSWLEGKGIQARMGFQDVKLVKGDQILAHVSLDTTFTSLFKGNCTATDKITAVSKIESAVKSLSTGSVKFENVSESGTVTGPGFSTSDHKLVIGNTVALKDADRMYQPVQGTSSDSRYHLVAIAGDLKIAARIKGNSVSLRAEGFTPEEHKKLIVAGFDTKNGYVSVHLQSNAQATANRIIGAVLVGTGLKFETVLPDVEVIRGKGL